MPQTNQAFDETQAKLPTEILTPIDAEPEFVVPFEFRAEFPEKVREFLAQINLDGFNKRGSYVIAEQQTKEYYLVVHQIPLNAWDFRNRREAMKKKTNKHL